MPLSKMQLKDIVEDPILQVRSIDSQHVADIRRALAGGHVVPPIVVEKHQGSHRVVCGFHRSRAWRALLGEDGEIEVQVMKFPSTAEAYKFALSENATHGLKLSHYDRVEAALKARRVFHLKIADIAGALHMGMDELKAMISRKTAMRNTPSGKLEPQAIKLSFSPLRGTTLTEHQLRVNRSSPGSPQIRMVKQLINIIECGAWDYDHDEQQECGVKLANLLLDHCRTKKTSAA